MVFDLWNLLIWESYLAVILILWWLLKQTVIFLKWIFFKTK